MAEKIWSKEFLDYENFIVNHPNYKDLSITQSEDGKYSTEKYIKLYKNI